MYLTLPEISGKIISISKSSKVKAGIPGTFCATEEFPNDVLWVADDGKRRLTSISCLSSEAFGGNCRCVNHSPYSTVREEQLSSGRFDEVVEKIEWRTNK